MRSALADDLEHELQALNTEVRRLDSEAASKKAVAEQMLADMKSSGVNPLLDADAFTKLDAAYKEADTLSEESSQLKQRRERVMGMVSEASPRTSGVAAGIAGWSRAVKILFDSPEVEAIRKRGGFQAQSGHIEVPGVEFMPREDFVRQFRGNIFGATADMAQMIPDDQRLFPPVPIPVRKVVITDLVTTTTTDSDLIRYTKETTRTDAAAATGKGTAVPEATYAYTEATAPVVDIGHFTPAHRSELDDVGQSQALISGRLRNGVDRKVETEIVSGAGGASLTGIISTSGIGSVAKSTAEPRLETLHRAITVVRVNLFDEPSAIALTPNDYQDVVFEKDTTNQYLLGPASQQTSRTIWGFPVAIASALADGTGLIGAFDTAVLYVRSGVSISMSDSHSTFFTERRVALMALVRVAFAVPQPKAFCQATGL